MDHPGTLEVIFYGPGALFELTIGGWLLLKGWTKNGGTLSRIARL